MKLEYHNPTRLIFGAGSLSRLGELARQYGKRALLVTGGGSVSATAPLSVRSEVSPTRVSPSSSARAWSQTPGSRR